MGRNAYIIDYKKCHLDGGSEFFDLIIKHFENSEGENYIEEHAWNEFIEANFDVLSKFRQECIDVCKDLKENGGAISYAFF